MDNVTHALAGLLIADAVVATQRARGRTVADTLARTAALAGVVAADLPDIDLLWSGLGRGAGALDYMLHHRGHTHTILVAVLGALALWGALLAWRRPLREPGARGPLLAVALLGTLSHILLDWTNSYGVHPFWPVDGAWVYGDAVFIVEPWLWVVAIPAALTGDRGRTARGVLALLLVAILALAWASGDVARGTAIALTAGTVAMVFAARRTRGLARPALALAAWIVVEATFFTGGRAAEAVVRRGVPAAADVVLTPGAGDPLCWSVMVVEAAGATPDYRVRSALVRPAPALRAARSCRVRRPADLAAGDAAVGPAGAPLHWTGEWRAPLAELRALAAADCRLAAALRFMRVPAWQRDGAATTLWDLRYGRGGFASVTSDGTGPCPTGVPSWTPPRADLLGSTMRLD